MSPGVMVSLEVATVAGTLFSTLCAWILGCNPEAVHNIVNPIEFPRKPQHKMKVLFSGLGKSRRGHEQQGEPGASAGRAEGWRGGCPREQAEWPELQARSEDGWTVPPGPEPVSAGDTPVLWGCFCSADSLSVQRAWVPLGTASPVTWGGVLLAALVTWSPTGQHGSPPRVPPHNTLVT